MCGIVGYIGQKQVVPALIDGLRRLEYRGYDAAGVAVVRDGSIDIRRSAGKLARLEEALSAQPLAGDYGVGHTREPPSYPREPPSYPREPPPSKVRAGPSEPRGTVL